MRISKVFKTFISANIKPEKNLLVTTEKYKVLFGDSMDLRLIGIYLEWNNSKRIIYKIKNDSTRKFIEKTNIHFIPLTPPESWEWNGVFALESGTKEPLFNDVYSILALYQKIKDIAYYIIAVLTENDYLYFFNIPCNFGKINAKTLDSDLDKKELMKYWQKEAEKEETNKWLEKNRYKVIKYLFASSYYIQNPDIMEIEHGGGEIKRKENGKIEKINGEPNYIWQYRNISTKKTYDNPYNERGEIDKTNKNYSATIVSPHIRKYEDKIIFIDAYSSHRWKKIDHIGQIINI